MSGLPAFIQAYRSVVFLKGLLFPPGRLGSTLSPSSVPAAAGGTVVAVVVLLLAVVLASSSASDGRFAD